MSSAGVEDKDTQDEDAISCICGSDIDDNATIQCDSCDRWQHMRCVGIDPSVVDIDVLVYHCDRCDPRPLDREAARAYIERYKREEAQPVQPRPRRGRGKGSGRRGGGTGSPLSRHEPRRQRLQKSSEDNDLIESNSSSNIGQRDYTWLNEYESTESAAAWMQKHVREYPACPPGLEMPILATVVKTLPESQGSTRGLFTERDAPSNAFVGRYLGVIGTRRDYETDETNRFDLVRGPLNHVAFVQQSSLVIDARKSGCETRFIRKSCTPNCTLVPLVVDQASSTGGYAWEFLIALKDNIQRGEEITIGHQWGVEEASQLENFTSADDLDKFANAVQSMIGECACHQSNEVCRIRKWLQPQKHVPQSRKRSPSIEASEHTESGAKTPNATTTEVPMTREERKIQMAIARMENADAPKAKRRRRDTGDETSRPVQSRRASSHKDEETDQPQQQAKRNASPPISPSAKTIKTQRGAIKSRAKLIRSPSPDYSVSQLVPRKLLWLRMYSEEKAASEEQRLRIAEQAREATARLAKETTRKKQELEQQAREAKEAKDREAEALKKQAEREAKEALQRAREREIWGDHTSAAPPVASNTVSNESGPEATAASTAIASRTSQPSPVPKSESPGPMGPPMLPREQTQASPPASVVPKIVRKLSVSEYLRQKKEREASEASPSPSTEHFRMDREGEAGARTNAIEDDKSDGEIEAGEVKIKREAYQTHQNGSPLSSRNEYNNPPPAAPKANASNISALSHGVSPGPLVHPSRAAYPLSGVSPHTQQPQTSGYFPPYGRSPYPPDQRSNRPLNGYNNSSYSSTNNNNNNQPPNSNNSINNNNNNSYRGAPANTPTGPKAARPSGSDSATFN